MQAIVRKLVSLDKYGEPIQVNYRGESSYQTLCGSFLTILSTGVVLAFVMTKGSDILTRSNPDLIAQSELIDYNVDDTMYNLKEWFVDVAIAF